MRRSLLVLLLISLLMVGCTNNERKELDKTDSEKEKIVDTTEKENQIQCEYIYLNSSPEEKKLEDITNVQIELVYSEDLKEMAKNANSIVIARVLGKEDAVKNKDDIVVNTPIKVEVINVLKGDDNLKLDTIYQPGGIISVENYMKGNTDKFNEANGYNKLSEEERKNTLLKILYPNYYKELKKDGVYIFILDKINDVYQSLNMSFSILEFDAECPKAKSLTKDNIGKENLKDEEGKDYIFKQSLDSKKFSPDKSFTLEQILKEINS